MVFPYLLDVNFEGGTLGAFNTETDVNNKLSFPHFSQMAPNPLVDMPYRGAYCMQVNLAGGTADAYLEELEGFDVALSTASHVRFYLFASKNLTMAANDTFDILQWQSVGPVNEFSINIFNNAGTIELRAGDTGGAVFRSAPLALGRWHAVELSINTGSGVNGTANVYLNGQQVGAQITGIASAALTQARIGTMGIDATTTAGYILFDMLVVDDTRVYPFTERYPYSLLMTATGHAYVGPGRVSAVELIAGAAADTCILYDSDEANSNDTGNIIAMASASTGAAPGETTSINLLETSRGWFDRGCYVVLTGTNPRAVVSFLEARASKVLTRQYGLVRPAHGVV